MRRHFARDRACAAMFGAGSCLLAMGMTSGVARAAGEPDPFEGRTTGEPAPLPLPEIADGPASSDDEPSFAPRTRRKPREPYKAEDVSPFVRNELALTGTVVFGTGYFSSIFVLAPQGFPNGGLAMLIPVAGPWITLAVRENVPGVSNEDGKRAFIAVDGVIQGAGAAMFLIGQFMRVTDPMGASVRPTRSFALEPTGSGLRAFGSF